MSRTLPSSLLDFAVAQSLGRQHVSAIRNPANWRMMHQVALAAQDHTLPPEIAHPQAFRRLRTRNSRKGGMAVRVGLANIDLEERVRALEVAGTAEQSSINVPSYSEEQLLDFYEDLLAIPAGETPEVTIPSRVPTAEEDSHTVHAIDLRLLESETKRDSGLLAVLQQNKVQTEKPAKYGPSHLPYQRVLWRVENFLNRTEAMRRSQDEPLVAPGIVALGEAEALIRVCLREEDPEAAEHSLSIAKRLGLTVPESSYNSVLEAYSNKGLVLQAERFLSAILAAAPTDTQRHLHVKAHLRSHVSDTIPESALAVLHHYEEQKLPAPMTTYTMVINSLYRKHSVLARAHAWDIFTHMRYVAHPKPDAFLYTMMIRACASPYASHRAEAERALDLWTEMTVDHGIQPTTGAYNAIILACARTGEAAYVNEAFRLAKQMLDAHRDAHGSSEFTPTPKTFSALLEGAKRTGDLGRARWILAEIVRVSDSQTEVLITEEIMMHVFHAYTSYSPPFHRNMAILKQPPNDASRVEQPSTEVTPLHASDGASVPEQTPHVQHTSFSHLAPQSRVEVIREVQSLFNRIVQSRSSDASELSMHDDKFSGVKLTSRLLNSYISVYYRHANLKTAKALFDTLYEEHGVRRDARSCIEALTRCSIAQNEERGLALEFATSVWERWMSLEVEMRHQAVVGVKALDGRLVEKARILMIRTLARSGKLDDALNHVRSFLEFYPPPNIRNPRPKLPMRSTRTLLIAPRPLVRSTTPAEVPDDTVPPLLTFGDLDILHHRLVAARRTKDIGYLKWVCKAYEGALRSRREKTMNANTEVPATSS